MAGDRKYTRIPPESTGDRILLVHTQEVSFDNLQGGHVWKRGAQYTITGNGGSTITITLHKAIVAAGGTSGYLVYEIDEDENYLNSPDVIDNQEIRLGGSGGTLVAYTSGTSYCVYVNGQTIVGKDNSTYAANVDRFGGLYTRFSEGAPEISGFGKLRVTEQSLLAQYDFSKSALKDEFANSQEQLGTATWQPDIGAIKLTVSGDNSIDRVTNTSHLFHPVVPGSGVLFIFAARSDSVTQGVIRNWGPFDATDGYFFQQNGTKLRVIHRYTLDGNATANMPMEQADWNRDTLDGSFSAQNPSGMNLDIQKINLYWVDYQFYGGGRTRWGVFYQGERIICHEMRHGNGEEGNVSLTNPIGNPNRPLCWAIANRTDADSASPDGSEANFWAFGGAVYLEADVDPLAESNIRNYQNNSFVLPATSTGTTYAFTLSPSQYYPEALAQDTSGGGSFTLSGGQLENHTIYSPLKLNVAAYNQLDDDVDRKVEIRLFQKCIMRGLKYTPVSFSSVEVDTVGDHVAHGPEFARFVVDGNKDFNFFDLFKTIQNGAVKNNSDQAFARDSQPITTFYEGADPELTGVKRIVVKIKNHPIYGSNIHFFDDKNKVVFRDTTNVTNPEVLAGFNNQGTLKTANTSSTDWHYLSFIDRDEAWIYNSTANIDDDRNARVINITGHRMITAGLAVGDRITLTGTGGSSGQDGTAYVLEVAGGGGANTVTLQGRSASYLDAGWVGTANNTSTDTDPVSSITTLGVGTYPLDYRTSLLALANTDVGITLTGNTITDQNSLYGPPPSRAAWTFMVRHLRAKSSNTLVRWAMTWKERVQ